MACVNGGFINEAISTNIILGDIPLIIPNGVHQFDYSFQPSNHSYFSSQQIPTNHLPSKGVTEPISIPGYAQLVVPSNQLNSVPRNSRKNGTILAHNTQFTRY